jgi:hypothetical protein
MPTSPRSGLPYVWVTWLTSLLCGDAQCFYAPWFKSHFKYDKVPSDFSLAAWQVEHAALVQEAAERMKVDGWTVTLENQNAFRLTGKTAILAGKPDAIGRKGNRVRIVDCKTGQPSNRDWVQVCIYLIAVPLAWNRPGLVVEGEVVYKTHTVSIAHEEPQQVRDRLFALLRRVGSDVRPDPVPSERECEWCDIAECAVRWTAPSAPVNPATAEAFF